MRGLFSPKKRRVLAGSYSLPIRKPTRLDGQAPADWVHGIEAELAEFEDASILTRTCAFGYYAGNFVALWEKVADHIAPGGRNRVLPRQRLWRIRAKHVVLATGAIERPLVFHGNDRPGTILASAARTYINRYGVLPGRKPVLFANNNQAWQAAFALQDAGASVAALIDIRPDVDAGLLAAASKRNIPVHLGAAITGTRGRRRVKQVSVRNLDGSGGVEGNETRIACDLVAVSGGMSPNIALFSQSRGKLRYDETLAAFRPGQSWQREISAGACNGTLGLADCLEEGAKAGARAAVGARMPRGARKLRHTRCLDAWKNRYPGPGHARIPQPRLHQCVEQTPARPVPLRDHARRGRHGHG